MLRKIDVGGVRYRVADEGVGPVLLLVHGFPLNHTMWRAQIEEFARTHRVIAPDLRGFGGTDGALYSVSMQQFADDLAELLEALAVEEPVIFCGLSMGGYIAWQFLQRHPSRVAKLVVSNTRAASDSPEAAANRLKMADIVLKEGPEPVAWAMMPKLFAQCTSDQCPRIIDEVRQMVMTSNPVAIAAAHRGMAVRPDVTGWLPEIRVPTLVICGEHDAISPAAEMQAFAGLIPGVNCVVIPNAGHMAPMEQPDLFNEAIRGFLG
ncbi:MAG: alpha/beta fold hydrolase [Planctomycetes bacterium]|nr:alpha/beta fold hydrolase [Planctomycetota bacterium]